MDDGSINKLSHSSTYSSWKERKHVDVESTQLITCLSLSPQFEVETISNGNSCLSLSLASETICVNRPPPAYALQKSPYLKAAQELLDEVVSTTISSAANSTHHHDHDHVHEGIRFLHELGLQEQAETETETETTTVSLSVSVQANLIALLNQLESRYEQYFSQMEQVISSFESILGTGAASSYTALTIQAMLKHFSNLRDTIISQINYINANASKEKEKEAIRHDDHVSLRNVGMRQVWRPLRGLPEDSVAVLRAWLFEHFLHPYPNDNEKLMLAVRTGLSRNQISNWFINARVRLWKPMIEEMYKEEFLDP